jgi:hypothetical protein
MQPTGQQYAVVTPRDSPADFFHSEATCQDTERLPNFPINHLPDELLLEIFDSYRRVIGPHPFGGHWKRDYGWFNLAHVCRKWRAVMFASSSRLDLGISATPKTLGDVKTVLPDPLAIFIDFRNTYVDITRGEISRMRAALEHHRGRVREIALLGGVPSSTSTSRSSSR